MNKEKHIFASAAVVLTVCLFSCAAFGALQEKVGDLLCKYSCDDSASFEINETDDALTCDMTIR